MKGTEEDKETPQRLSQQGGVFSALAELKDSGLGAERLRLGAKTLAQHIAQSGVAVGGGGMLGLGLAGKLGLFLIAVSLVGGSLWLLGKPEPSPEPSVSSAQLAPPSMDAGSPPLALGTDDAGLHLQVRARLHALEQPQSQKHPQVPKHPQVLKNPQALEDLPPNTPSADKSKSPRPAAIKGIQKAPIAALPPASQLPAQLLLLREAKSLARKGQHKKALERLADLERQFPDSPLGAEIQLRKAVSLSGTGDFNRALPAIRQLLNDPRHRGKRAQLHTMLVDLYLAKGKCAQAQHSLRSAVEAGLTQSRRTFAESGLARCWGNSAAKEKK